ncbi:MAG: hypothetical protein DME65_12350 [Verrucomicrobia bacterium]|nr:MAG: hypothetical protein DME65_12350 [Verrucomicrobiota bacterium]
MAQEPFDAKPILLIENERAYADLLKAAFAHVKVRNPLAVVTSDREAMELPGFDSPGDSSSAL